MKNGETDFISRHFRKKVQPTYGLGDEKHDYGKGFYLTESSDLAREWAVCRPNETNGWLHKFERETDELNILDFGQCNVLSCAFIIQTKKTAI